MNKIKTYFLSALMLTLAITGCKKDENKIYFEGGTNPVLTASTTAAMTLLPANQANTAIKFSWTNPNYKFTTGVSSQDVNYILQVDTTGSNFSNPNKQEISISKELDVTFTVKEFNAILAKLGMQENMPHNIEFRVKASLLSNSIPLYSNVLKIVITPYLDVVYPVPANLFIVGDATPGGWSNPVPDPSQKLNKISSTAFSITLPLNAGKSYLLLPVNGSWSAKYGCLGGNNTNNPNGDDFKPEGGDILAPSVTKTYTITLEFKTGKFTVQ